VNRALALRWRVRVAWLVLVVPPLLHLFPTNRLVAMLGRIGHAPRPDLVALVAEVDAWQWRLPWPWRSTCLKRATVLYALLRQMGDAVSLRIGVRRGDDGAFLAHAWLMRDGAIYLEPTAGDPSSYAVIAEFPEEAVSRS
jgi:hypothetical protein